MLTLWNPLVKRNGSAPMPPLLSDFDRLFSEMDRALGETLPTVGWSVDALTPAADVAETDEAITVRVDLPGHDAKNIAVNVENDILTVRSERTSENERKDERMHRIERSYGLYARSFALPATVDAQKAEARYDNGVLTITLPKRPEARPKAIDIKVRS
jgi:HSP20 family protein